MTLCVISQPRLFPGLHYLHRMLLTDVFVILDTVQFSPRHEENRTKIKGPQGEQWLTVPMRKSSREQLILDTQIDNSQAWRRKAVKTIAYLYKKTPYYKTYSHEIMSILEAPYETLVELDQASWKLALQLLDVRCEFIHASELPVQGSGPRLLLDICCHLGADMYLSGAFGREYLDISEFASGGIRVKFHEFNYPVYSQQFGDFVPFLSYLDMLMNIDLNPDEISAGGRMIDPD